MQLKKNHLIIFFSLLAMTCSILSEMPDLYTGKRSLNLDAISLTPRSSLEMKGVSESNFTHTWRKVLTSIKSVGLCFYNFESKLMGFKAEVPQWTN